MPHDVLVGARTTTPLLRDALAGLGAEPKTLPSKYLYDAEGSRLFEAICDLPEYHVTRTEIALLREVARAISVAIPPDAVLVEFGSGASIKTRLVLDAAPQLGAYVPIEISEVALEQAAQIITAEYPWLTVSPLVDDFTQTLALPSVAAGRPRLGFFPGSTIGNFSPAEAAKFLSGASRLLGPGSQFILGADLTRSSRLLIPAYDDSAGVTAAFNLNLLARLNRECGADFDEGSFAHSARWNAAEGRMEMHLVSLRDQIVTIGRQRVHFLNGETIHTENSYKYSLEMLRSIVGQSGWRVAQLWEGNDPKGDTDDCARFGILLLEFAEP